MVYAGLEDIRKRKITTITFLALNVALLIFYLISDAWVALFLIPIIAEYFLKKYALILYAVLVIPVVFDASLLTLTLTYSIILVKLFGLLFRNFGKGDVKVLQTIAVTIPLYPHLPVIDSLFTPVLGVMLIASALGTVAGLLKNGKAREHSIRQFTPSPMPEMAGDSKFWLDGSRRSYKIPFVAFVTVGYALIFSLSLLRLV